MTRTDRAKYEPIRDEDVDDDDDDDNDDDDIDDVVDGRAKCWSKKMMLLVGMTVILLVLSTYVLARRVKSNNDYKKTLLVYKLLGTLNEKMQGKVLFPTDDGFSRSAKVWNECASHSGSDGQRLPVLAVVEPMNEGDVRLAVPVLAQLFSKHDVPFRIKSGGHSYTGWSSVGGGIILSLTQLNHVTLDKTTGVATLGPAATVEDVLQTALPHYGGVVGFCPGVAAGGYALGGGWGVQSRMYGLGLDSIRSARMVTANGSVVVATDNRHGDDHVDLFFALRGAGQNSFGVVTEMQYQLHPMPQQSYGQELLVVEGMVPLELIPRLNEKLGHLEKKIPNNWVAIYEGNLEGSGRSRTRALPFALYFTPTEDMNMEAGRTYAKKSLLPSLMPDEVANEFTIETRSWYNWTIENGNFDGNYIRAWNGFLFAEQNTVEIWSEIMDAFVEVLHITHYVIVDTEIWGGALSSKAASNETAFPYRDALWNVGLGLAVPVSEGKDLFDECVAQIDEIWPRAAQYLDGVYLNYQMESLTKKEYPHQYWGGNLERLTTLKASYDPTNIFRSPQSVPLPML